MIILQFPFIKTIAIIIFKSLFSRVANIKFSILEYCINILSDIWLWQG